MGYLFPVATPFIHFRHSTRAVVILFDRTHGCVGPRAVCSFEHTKAPPRLIDTVEVHVLRSHCAQKLRHVGAEVARGSRGWYHVRARTTVAHTQSRELRVNRQLSLQRLRVPRPRLQWWHACQVHGESVVDITAVYGAHVRIQA